jgi:hypothetical protein
MRQTAEQTTYDLKEQIDRNGTGAAKARAAIAAARERPTPETP